MAPGTAERAELRIAGEAFSKIADQMTMEIGAGRVTEALRLRDESLRLAFDRYLERIANANDLLTRESMRANQEASARAGGMSTLMLSLGSWPVVLLGALMLFLAVFLLRLLVLLRGSEVSEKL